MFDFHIFHENKTWNQKFGMLPSKNDVTPPLQPFRSSPAQDHPLCLCQVCSFTRFMLPSSVGCRRGDSRVPLSLITLPSLTSIAVAATFIARPPMTTTTTNCLSQLVLGMLHPPSSLHHPPL